jgi:hypothetical protein
VSSVVHRLLSAQGVPLLLGGFVQVPVAGLQTPSVWHWLGAAQVTGLVPRHIVPSHTSVRVQRSSSLQARPSRGPHAPSALVPAARLQAWQSFVSLPPQALLQQTPSVQKVDRQSLPAEQAPPFSTSPQRPPRHFSPAAHWLSRVQVRSHALPAALHTMMGVQASVSGGGHCPAAVQNEGLRACPLLQLAGEQGVPGAYTRQPPRPSQRPSVPQEVARWSMHRPAGSAPPLGTLPHVPRRPASAHDWQVPSQGLLQQMPWAQMPEAHSCGLLAEQTPPLGILPHEPF